MPPCTCDYAGLEGEWHKDWCEIVGGPHAECKSRNEALEQSLERFSELCPCVRPPTPHGFSSIELGCPVHGDTATFVERVKRLEVIAAAGRHWLAYRPAADTSWSESTRKLAAAMAELDGAS